MIDIHSHLLYDVDDGSKSLEQSVKYLKQIKKIGMKDLVITPHIKDNISIMPKILKNFEILKKEAFELGINLYLGNEIMYSDSIIELLKNKKILSLNNTKYILVEFKRYENMPFDSIVMIFTNIIAKGYKPILCHPELYINYRNIDYIRTLRELGVLIQVDSTSFFGSYKVKKFTKKLLKEYLIDIVASDSHCTSKRNYLSLKKAYNKIGKWDFEYAHILFETNPKIILNI